MQYWAKPWAKRGVQAALVTGGMLAAGTGVASASGNCPDRPAPPLGESALSPANSPSLRHGVPCFAGELFPEHEIPGEPHENAPITSRSAGHPVTMLSGDLNARSEEPAAAPIEQPKSPWVAPEVNPNRKNPSGHSTTASDRPRHRAQDAPTKRFVDVEPGNSSLLFGLLPLGGQERQLPSGTPSQGFLRSVSWSGPIGEVVDRAPRNALEDTVPLPPSGLIRPSVDPAVFNGFAEPDGIVDLWRGSLGRGLLTPDTVDLTHAELTGPRAAFHFVPPELLASVLDTLGGQRGAREAEPLAIPGEHQLAADEVPDLLGELTLPAGSGDRGTTERTGDQGVHGSLPLVGELNAFHGGESSVPVVSRITEALSGGGTASEPRFSASPLESTVVVSTIDELEAAIPEGKLVTRNPFTTGPRATTEPRIQLPRTDGSPLPNITALQGQTLPINGDLVDSLVHTTPLPRLVSNA